MATPNLFDTTVSSLYETVLDPAQWDGAIANVAQLFSASTAAMFHYDFIAQLPSQFRGYGHSLQVQRAYESYYHRIDPGRDAGMQARVGEWIADEPILDVRAPHCQEYVQDFALRSGIGHAAGFKVVGDSSSCVFLGLQRSPDAERFGEQGLATFTAIAPHLRRITQMRTRMDQLSSGLAVARACLDRLQSSVLVVDRSRRVVLVNSHGLRTLDAERTFNITNQRLTCALPPIDDHLEHAVAAACGPRPRGDALRVPRERGRPPLLLHVLPVPPTNDLSSLLPEPLALVMIGDPAAPHLSAETYRSLFSLTQAEAALMSALVAGISVREWAAQRGIAVSTVRTQVASLLEKAGVDSQARLVSLAKSLPPAR